MTIYFYYYNIFWDFFSVPPFTFYTQEKNIVHKKEFEIPREKKSFILKREQPENEICVERNTTTYTHTYYTLKTDVIAYNNVEKTQFLYLKRKTWQKINYSKILSCLIISHFELVIGRSWNLRESSNKVILRITICILRKLSEWWLFLFFVILNGKLENSYVISREVARITGIWREWFITTYYWSEMWFRWNAKNCFRAWIFWESEFTDP